MSQTWIDGWQRFDSNCFAIHESVGHQRPFQCNSNHIYFFPPACGLNQWRAVCIRNAIELILVCKIFCSVGFRRTTPDIHSYDNFLVGGTFRVQQMYMRWRVAHTLGIDLGLVCCVRIEINSLSGFDERESSSLIKDNVSDWHRRNRCRATRNTVLIAQTKWLPKQSKWKNDWIVGIGDDLTQFSHPKSLNRWTSFSFLSISTRFATHKLHTSRTSAINVTQHPAVWCD